MLNENMESGFCQYCGSKILVQAAIAFQKVVVEGTVKTRATDFTIRAGILEAYNGEEIDVIIPSNVFIIGYKAFMDCVCLRSVTIPDSVTEIGVFAFWGCHNLSKVNIPNSVKKIGEKAFMGCRSLTSIVVPDSVTEIGPEAFRECSRLTSISLPGFDADKAYRVIDGCNEITDLTISSTNYMQFYSSNRKKRGPDYVEGPDFLPKLERLTLSDGKSIELFYLPRRSPLFKRKAEERDREQERIRQK